MAATGPETSPSPLTFDARRLADSLARALPPLSNRTLSSLLGRLDGEHAIDAAARAALRVLHGRTDDQARGPRSPNRRPAESRSPKPSSAEPSPAWCWPHCRRS